MSTCRNCRFWHSPASVKIVGSCKRFPPNGRRISWLKSMLLGLRGYRVTAWPMTWHGAAGCGEFKND
jgi:hypothetical protein